jgi:hypothetical protein
MARAQIPEGDFRFRAYGQLDKPADAPPIVVSSYRMTNGQ